MRGKEKLLTKFIFFILGIFEKYAAKKTGQVRLGPAHLEFRTS